MSDGLVGEAASSGKRSLRPEKGRALDPAPAASWAPAFAGVTSGVVDGLAARLGK